MQFNRVTIRGGGLTLAALGLMTSLALAGCGGGGGGGGSSSGGGSSTGGTLSVTVPSGDTGPGGSVTGTATLVSPSNSSGLPSGYQFADNGTFTTNLPNGPYTQPVTVSVPYNNSSPSFVAILKNGNWTVLPNVSPPQTCFGVYNATPNPAQPNGTVTVAITNPAGISQIAVVYSPNGTIPSPPSCS